MKIESKIGSITSPAEQVYNFIADFRNFNRLIPEGKITNWNAEQEKCSFTIDMLGSVCLYFVEKEPCKLLKIATDPKVTKHNLTLWVQLKEVDESHCKVKITVEPKINQMMAMMVKSPLKNFVDTLIDQIETIDFSNF